MTPEKVKAIQAISAAITTRAEEIGCDAAEISKALTMQWTGGVSNDYMKWFQDSNFDHVLKPDHIDTSTMSASEIEAAVCDEQLRIIIPAVEYVKTFTFDGEPMAGMKSNEEPEVKIPEPEPEAKPPAPTEPIKPPAAEPEPEASPASSRAAEAAAKLRKRKEEQNKPPAPTGISQEDLDEAILAVSESMDAKIKNANKEIAALKAHNEELAEKVLSLSKDNKALRGDLDTLLEVIESL
jgi:FtsZ-binding cell division protein ZapB